MPLSISTLVGGKKDKHIEIEWVDFISQLASYYRKLAYSLRGRQKSCP